MKQQGYDTYFTGKWHVNVKPSTIFDVARHVRGGMPGDSPQGYERKFEKGIQDEWTPTDSIYGGYWKGGEHWSEVVRDDALDYIQMAKKKDNPFFMYIAFNAPHDPRQSPQQYQDMYDLESIKLPPSYMPLNPYREEMNARRSLRDERLATFPRTRRSVLTNRKEYYALISHMDHQIGLILDALKKTGKLDNTYIIFTADHGLGLGDHGFIGKQNLYEASVRVPLMIAGPGIKKNSTVDGFVYLQDVMATALDIADSPAVDSVSWRSFLPVAEGKPEKMRDDVINMYEGCQRMIRTDRYKMIMYPTCNAVLLYDEVNDPWELKDLAQNPENIPLMKKLYARFKELQKETHDPVNIDPCFDFFIRTLE